jgi:hypothetical protein
LILAGGISEPEMRVCIRHSERQRGILALQALVSFVMDITTVEVRRRFWLHGVLHQGLSAHIPEDESAGKTAKRR